MTLQALLVSADDSAADVLGRVLPTLGLAMDRLSDRETTLARIQQQKFDEARDAWLICGRWLRQMDEEESYETALRNAAELFEREGNV